MMNNKSRSIVADKTDVLEALTANRYKHSENYQEAKRGWVIESKARLKKELKRVSEGRNPDLDFSDLRKPTSHLKEYDLVIEMLDFDKADVVTLTTEEFRNYVKDEWDFMRHWRESNSGYITTASEPI